MKKINEIQDFLPEESAIKFAEILKDAVTSYIESMEKTAVDSWLKSYLQTQLPEKSLAEIEEISGNILNSIQRSDIKMQSMQAAIENGKSVESWFADEAMSESKNGEQAKRAAECHAALTEISNLYEDADNQEEVLDVDVIPSDEWNNENWNHYRMKDVLIETAKQAGNVAVKNTANDLYSRIMEYGVKTVLTDKTLITDSVMNGAKTGIKAATSGALEIAKYQSIIPDLTSTPTGVLANIASIAIENVNILRSIANGDVGLSEGLSKIKNTTVAHISGLFAESFGVTIGAAIGSVVGPIGTAVGGFVGGAVGKFAGTKVGTAIVSAGKKVCSAAKSVAKKIGSGIKSIGSKICSFFRR